MKRKIFICLLVVLSLFMVSACGKKSEPKKEEPKLAADEVVLENIKYKLDQDESEYGIKFKIASNFRKTTMINAVNYFSENIDDSPYFVIRIYKYPNKDIEYAIKDSVETVEDRKQVTIGDKEYTKVYFTNYNGAKTHLFYYTNKKTTYTFVFTSSIDLSRLENIFLENINYD